MSERQQIIPAADRGDFERQPSSNDKNQTKTQLWKHIALTNVLQQADSQTDVVLDGMELQGNVGHLLCGFPTSFGQIHWQAQASYTSQMLNKITP